MQPAAALVFAVVVCAAEGYLVCLPVRERALPVQALLPFEPKRDFLPFETQVPDPGFCMAGPALYPPPANQAWGGLAAAEAPLQWVTQQLPHPARGAIAPWLR